LEEIRRRRGLPLEPAVNDALRESLSRMDEPAPAERFRTRAVSAGGFRLGNLDDVSAVLEAAEGDQLA
jgi:hypothetical protein